MKILLVDPIPAAGAAIAGSLRDAIRHETLHATSSDSALKVLEVQKDSIGIIVKFLDYGPEDGISFIQEVHEFSRIAAIRCPKVVLLTPGDLSASYESRFRSSGAECIVYGYPKQLRATVKRLMFESRCENGKSTIVVDRRGGIPQFYVLGPAT
ncbi:MAG TPA: hypothetical protein VFB43_19350 [Terracidiphilus sp.]|nr:hypothetical protein [Terracidiphilus sp.]